MCRQQLLDTGCDGTRREHACRSHRLELALACPVCDAAEMVDVTMADHDRVDGRESAVGATCVEGEVKLRQQNHGPVSGSRSADDGQLSPCGVELEATQDGTAHLAD